LAAEAIALVFRREPTNDGPVTVTVFDDTRGNRIQIYQP
jgi:hypothetical protein